MTVTGDNPIEDTPQDLLGRASLAKHLADELRHVDASNGGVVAVMGPWGSGKTSLINLMRGNLETEPPLTVLDFNPWMFSGTEQLVESFFSELAAQLEVKDGRLGKIATELNAYGELLSPLGVIPVVGPWITRFGSGAKTIKQFHERRKESVTRRRAKLADIMAKLERPLVVVIDDIDRLDTKEIRDIFKLVRLTASFPNVIYLLAFDRHRVEQALSDIGLTGRSYLEKIVQVSIDIPSPSPVLLRNELLKTLDVIIEAIHEEPRFDQQRWQDVYAEIIGPMIRSIRDIRRYAASLRGTLRSLQGEVELVDVLAMEAIRVFAPDLFIAATSIADSLTAPASGYVGDTENPVHKDAISNFLATSEEHATVAKALIRRVFQAADRHLQHGTNYGSSRQNQWIRERRLAHPALLSFYLERLKNNELNSFNRASHAFLLMTSAEDLEGFFDLLDPEDREDAIGALEAYEGEYPVETVVPGSIGLLNVLPTIPEREEQGMFSVGDGRLTVTRVVLRLFDRIEEADQHEQAVRDILPQVTTLSSKLQLIEMVGHRDNVGHGLVSEEAAGGFEEVLGAEIQEASASTLSNETELFRLALWMRENSGNVPEFWNRLFGSPELNHALLMQSVHRVRRQSADSRAISRETRLYWDTLETIYDGPEALRNGMQSVRHDIGNTDPDTAEAAELAMKYLSGWRPKQL